MNSNLTHEKRLGTALYNAVRNAMDKMGSQYVWTHYGHAYGVQEFKDYLQFKDVDVLKIKEKASYISVTSAHTTFTVYKINSMKHDQAVDFVKREKRFKELKKRQIKSFTI